MDAAKFLQTVAAEPWQWGVNDCCSILDRWLVLRGVQSPKGHFGWHYQSEHEAQAIIKAQGGLIPMLRKGLGGVGLIRIQNPNVGDVGLVIAGGVGCAAVKTGKLWQSRSESGRICAAGHVEAWCVNA